MQSDQIRLKPIGILHTPWRTLADCPRNGRQPKPAPACTAELFPEYRDGLLGLEGLTHLILLYWLGPAPAPALRFTPPFSAGPRGIFATRSPNRPNPIGLSVVAFDGEAAPGRLAIRYLDCLDGTPLLDVKPYLTSTDCEPGASMGWLAPHATKRD
jgi:tRNA-Thr(GGU) m(6)t(6)A37 methyltransferase TsaA